MSKINRKIVISRNKSPVSLTTIFGAGVAALAQQSTAQPIDFEFSDFFISFYECNSVVAADLNGDALIDIVRTETNGKKTRKGIIYFGNTGGGIFEMIAATDIAADQAKYMYAGDLDKDHDIDLAWINGSRLIIFTNDGNGVRGSLDSYPLTSTPSGLQFADLDGDRDLDAVVSYKSSVSAFTIFTNVNGNLLEKESYPATYNILNGLVLGDVDLDGDVDIMVLEVNGDYTYYYSYGNYCKISDSQITVFSNSGSGSFVISNPIPIPFNNNTHVLPSGLTGGDLDGDKDLDLIVIAYDTGSASEHDQIVAMINNDNGSNFAAQPILVSDNYSISDVVALADFDNDGDLDLATDANAPVLSIIENLGDLVFGTEYYFNTNMGDITDIAMNDLNEDGLLDITVAGDDGITILMNTTAYNGITMTHDRLIRGESSTFTIEGGGLYEKVCLYYSKNGYSNSTGKLFYGGMTLDLADPIIQAATGFTNDLGTAHINLAIPDDVPLMNVTFQAAIQRGIGNKDSVKTPISIGRIEKP